MTESRIVFFELSTGEVRRKIDRAKIDTHVVGHKDGDENVTHSCAGTPELSPFNERRD